MTNRSFRWMALAAMISLVVAGTGSASSQGKSSVAITSPTDGTALNQSSVDVTVAFSASTGGNGAGGNVKVIQLLANQQLLATFNNPPQIKSGTHTFTQVDLSAFIGQTVALVARAFQGNEHGGNSTDSETVNIAVEPQQKPTLGMTKASCMRDSTDANKLNFTWTVAWTNQTTQFTAKVTVTALWTTADGALLGSSLDLPSTNIVGGGAALPTDTFSGSGSVTRAQAPQNAGGAQFKITITNAKTVTNVAITPDPASATTDVCIFGS
jgi:hypothetical protein